VTEAHPGAEERTLSRILNFSDAVFAIVLTLLALELRLPEATGAVDLAEALVELVPKFIAFTSSFALVIIFWAGHVTILRRLVHFDWPVAWVNALFLLVIAFMPFASSLIGEGAVIGLAWTLYCGVLVAASIAQIMLVLCVARDGGRLVGGMTARQLAWRGLRSLSPGIAFGIGLALNLLGQPQYSVWCWTLIPPLMALSGLLFGPRRQPRPRSGDTHHFQP
jgi:uncharacterized membrane protein